jgi:hypothetical protein
MMTTPAPTSQGGGNSSITTHGHSKTDTLDPSQVKKSSGRSPPFQEHLARIGQGLKAQARARKAAIRRRLQRVQNRPPTVQVPSDIPTAAAISGSQSIAASLDDDPEGFLRLRQCTLNIPTEPLHCSRLRYSTLRVT